MEDVLDIILLILLIIIIVCTLGSGLIILLNKCIIWMINFLERHNKRQD